MKIRRRNFVAIATCEARRSRLAELCEIERRNSDILDRLRVTMPEATEQELLEEHKNVVFLAMIHRPPGSEELPMEFAVEAQKLLAISLEGSVG